jgi:hypothetical protein
MKRTTLNETREPAPDRKWWLALAGMLALAAWLRVCNLGTFSLWLDEVFTMSRSMLPFPGLLAEALRDADNMPFYLFITHACLRIGMVEPWLRLVPILAGLGSIVVWARWTWSHFGPRVSLLTAGAMTLLTFHVRHSQELRAYPYLFFVTGLTMLLTDRLRAHPSAVRTAALALAIALGWYTHLSFAMLMIPLVGLVLFVNVPGDSGSEHRKKSLPHVASSLVLGTLLFLPWLVTIATQLHARMDRGATELTFGVAKRRWQYLTVAANELEPLSWLGILLALFCFIGLVTLGRKRIGQAVLIPAVSTVFVFELLYQIVNRWSKPRYYTAVWPFVVVILVVGLERILKPVHSKWVRTAAYSTLAIALVVQVDGYHRRGRPHWDRMAAAIEEVQRPNEPVLTESAWVANGVGMYTDRSVTALRWRTEPLLASLGAHPSVLLVTSYHRPVNRDLFQLARRGVVIAVIPETGFLRRIRPDMIIPWIAESEQGWPEPAAQPVAADLEAPLEGCLGRLAFWHPSRSGSSRAGRPQIGFDRPHDPALRSGWSAKTHSVDGDNVRWVRSREAVMDLERIDEGPASVEIELSAPRKLPAPQEMRVLVNETEVGTREVPQRPTTIRLQVESSAWRRGRNLLVLHFKATTKPTTERGLPRAAAVHWIRITE